MRSRLELLQKPYAELTEVSVRRGGCRALLGWTGDHPTRRKARVLGARTRRLPLNFAARLLQAEAFADQALEAGFVEDVESQLFVGEHGQGSALGVSDEFGGFLVGQVRILSDDRRDHAHHELEAADFAGFFLLVVIGFRLRNVASDRLDIAARTSHAAPVRGAARTARGTEEIRRGMRHSPLLLTLWGHSKGKATVPGAYHFGDPGKECREMRFQSFIVRSFKVFRLNGTPSSCFLDWQVNPAKTEAM